MFARSLESFIKNSSISMEFPLLYLFCILGYIPGIMITMGLIFLVVAKFRAGFQLRSEYGGGLAGACSIPLILQLALSISHNFARYTFNISSKVPFLSTGGFYLVSTILMTTIILSIWRTRLEYKALIYERWRNTNEDN
jgi:hypothetical protein